MELKEYLAIFKKHFKVFIAVTVIFIAAGIIFQITQPLRYKTSLTLNVTRNNIQPTSDYRYDDFYRLQADEKFADTIVRWLESPGVSADIYNDSGISTTGLTTWQLERIFKAERLSSQVISVTYITSDAKTAQNLAKSIAKIVNRESDNLNKLQKEESWFTVVSNEPVIRDNRWPLPIVFSASLLLGIFFGIWAVLIRHYLKD